MKIKSRPYRCTTCENEFKAETNHIGEIYGCCKKCNSFGESSIAVCICENAIEARQNRPQMRVSVYPYRFNIGDAAQLAAYIAMSDSLKTAGIKCFSHWTRLNKNHCSTAAIVRHMQSGAINMSVATDWNGGQQWTLIDGGRLHAWAECCYPNKSIKFGYHIAISDFDKLPKLKA